MPLDPNIAMSYRPTVALDTEGARQTSLLNQGIQQKNMLAELQAQQEQEQQNFMNNAYRQAYDPVSGQIDYNKMQALAATNNRGSLIPGMQSQQTAGIKAIGEANKSKYEAAVMRTQEHVNALRPSMTPNELLAWRLEAYSDPVLSATMSGKPDSAAFMDEIQRAVAQGPQAYQDLIASYAAGGNKHVAAMTMTANERSLETDRAAGRTNATGQLRVAQGNLAVNQAAETRQNNAYQSSIDPELQAQLAEAKKRGEEKAGKGPAATSAAAAQAFLTSAGYNAETGEDEVSKLIPESTGGAIATGLAKAAGAFNVTTTGQAAIGQLASRSSKLVLDLLGGKLGAGVSNADREFMLQAAGDIGNSMLPVGVRLAAWNDLMGRMKTAAGSGAVSAAAPSPGKPAALPAAAAAQLKENIHTTFKNGQIWTLQNGQPVQVK